MRSKTISPAKIVQTETLYHDSKSYFEALIEELKTAQKSVELETYILGADELSEELLNTLTLATGRGVQVRLLVDGIGSLEWLKDQGKNFESIPNFQLRVYHPLPWFFFWWKFSHMFKFGKLIQFFMKINKRNHKKVCLIDHNVAYTGSINFFKKSFSWRESGVRISGEASLEVLSSFEISWKQSTPLQDNWERRFISSKPNKYYDTQSVLTNFTLKQRITHNQQVVNAVYMSTDRVWITNPYFVPPLNLLKALCHAAERGVDVRLLLPQKIDVPVVRLISQYYFRRLIKAGVHIFEYTPAILHAKIILIDNYATIGSSNLNYRSFFHDLELDIVLQNQSSVKSIEDQFLVDLKQTEQIQIESLEKRNIFKRLLARLFLLIKNWM